MSQLEAVDLKRQNLLGAQLALIQEECDTVKRIRFACVHCAKTSKLSRWDFVQDHWYEGPWGCMGGDTWHSSKTEVCHLACPHCRQMNYIYNHPERQKIVELCNRVAGRLSQVFTNVWDKHGDAQPKLRTPTSL